MKAVYRTLNIADADLVRARLEAAGFHAAVLDAIAAFTTEGYSLTTQGIRVEVPDSEADEARAFLEAPEAPGT
jgi:hypothetical protein